MVNARINCHEEKSIGCRGAGYIGSDMLLALREAGYEATIFDNLSRGHADAAGGAPIVRGDLRTCSDVESCLCSGGFDIVMHFAPFAYVGVAVADPKIYYQNNVVGTLNPLSAMRKHGTTHLVFSSTCATYGEPEALSISVEHSQSHINPYGRSKLMIETILRNYGYAYGLRSISLRYFNAAGCDPLGRVGERHEPETHLIPLVLEECYVR
jgi:UDP-glucose 4-epimerase